MEVKECRGKVLRTEITGIHERGKINEARYKMISKK